MPGQKVTLATSQPAQDNPQLSQNESHRNEVEERWFADSKYAEFRREAQDVFIVIMMFLIIAGTAFMVFTGKFECW